MRNSGEEKATVLVPCVLSREDIKQLQDYAKRTGHGDWRSELQDALYTGLNAKYQEHQEMLAEEAK